VTLDGDNGEDGAEQRRRLRLALEAATRELLRRRKLVRLGALVCALCAALAAGGLMLFSAVH
jgi:hypothetical protein